MQPNKSILVTVVDSEASTPAVSYGERYGSAKCEFSCNISRKASRVRKFVRNVEAKVQRERKSAVLRVRRLAGRRLTFMLAAEDDSLRQFAEESKTGRAGKTLVKEGPLRITLVALKKGTALPSHHVEGPISIHTIRGCLRLTTERGDLDLSAGSLIALGPGVVHAAKAHEDCAILLTFAMP